MKLKTGIAVLAVNALLVLAIGQALQGEAPPEGPSALPVVQASVTVPGHQDPVVVEGALSSNTRGWAHASQAAVSATEKGIRPELVDAYSLAVAASPLDCHLTVSLLAAIGQVESGNLVGHGLDSEHRAVPAILGPVLDGKRFAAIEDTDNGKLDGDKRWDRAVGPMQFVPASWRVAGVDMDGDGRRDPQDVDDAAGTAMVYLCAGGRDLATEEGLNDAVLSYNHSVSYLRLVLAWKAVFDRNPLVGWAALPVLDAWEQSPIVAAVLPSPTTVTDPRTNAPAPGVGTATPATPGTAAAPVIPVPSTGTPGPPATPGATPSTGPTPTGPTPGDPTPGDPTPGDPTPTDPAPAQPSTPATEPDPKPTPDPTPTPDPLPTCPVPSPTDPAATPSPSVTPDEDGDGTATADVPGDGTAEPVECELPIDPETGEPVSPTPDAEPSTEPGAGGG
ncbi:MAG: lytic murein transglycosylase [Marmoricola sp.]